MKKLIQYSIAIFSIAITFSSCQKEPEACFTPSSSSVETGASISFLNCTDNGDSYLWNFGDNSTSTSETPTHIFNSPGIYLVSLTAYSKNEKKKSNISKTITVTSPTPPTVAITSPADEAGFITGDVVNITATASDNGSVASVQFLVDGVSVGIDLTSPYSATYTGTTGSHNLNAVATDNNGTTTTSSTIVINVQSNTPQPPISNPLSYNSYSYGSITSSTDILWYSFNVTNGVTYNLQWDDSYDGSGAYTADIIVNVFKSNLTTTYISDGDSGFTIPRSFTATETGIVYVRVTPYNASTGTFALGYY